MLRNLLDRLFSSLIYLLPSAASQRGQSTAYIIILVVVVIFAVMLSGGSHSLFTGNHPSSVNDTPTAGADTTPTAFPTSVAWSIDATILSCNKDDPNDPAALGTMKATGSEKGYIYIKTIDSSGNAKPQIVTGFDPPKSDFEIKLAKTHSFSDSKWTIELYSGGTIVNNALGGGVLKASVTKDPTRCL